MDALACNADPKGRACLNSTASPSLGRRLVLHRVGPPPLSRPPRARQSAASREGCSSHLSIASRPRITSPASLPGNAVTSWLPSPPCSRKCAYIGPTSPPTASATRSSNARPGAGQTRGGGRPSMRCCRRRCGHAAPTWPRIGSAIWPSSGRLSCGTRGAAAGRRR